MFYIRNSIFILQFPQTCDCHRFEARRCPQVYTQCKIDLRPQMPSIVTKEGKGVGQPCFCSIFFHFLVVEIGKTLTIFRWPFPGLTDDLGIAVISFFCCYKWGSGALWFFHLQMINRYCPAVKKESLMALEIINTKAGYKINCTRSDEERSLSATLMWCRSVRS